MNQETTMVEKIRKKMREYDTETVCNLIKQALRKQFDPIEILEGLANEIREIGEGFNRGTLFLFDLVAAADTMNSAMKVILPFIEGEKAAKSVGRFLIGTVEGDIHDIGKNIVASFLMASGFEVIDIGRDQPVKEFIRKARKFKPDIVGASALLSTTMVQQKELIKALKKEGLRNKIKVMIGGAPTSREWAEKIGADAYARNAVDAARIAAKLMEVKEGGGRAA